MPQPLKKLNSDLTLGFADFLLPSSVLFVFVFALVILSIQEHKLLNVLVFLLYWLIRLFGGFGVQTEDWSIFQILSDYYAHFGTSAFLFYEVILYSKAFKNPSKELPVFAGIFIGYITWMEFFVQINNTAPCGAISCGFPYEFLNDLDYIGRLIFYGIVLFMGVSSWIGSYQHK